MAIHPPQDDILIRVQQRLAQRGITGAEAASIVAKIEAKLGRVSGPGVGMQRAVGQPSIPTPRGEPVDPRYAKFQVDPNDPLVARGLKPRQIAATPEEIAANGTRFAAPTTQPVEDMGMFRSGAKAIYGGLEDAGDFGITADMLAADNRVTPEVGNRFAQIQAQKRSRPMSEGAAAYAQASQGGAMSLLSFAADRPGAFLQGAIDQNLQSLGSTAASIVGAPLAGALAPSLMGSGSGLAEASNELAAALEAEGVDVTDGGAVTRAMNTPDVRARVRDRVLTKSTTVGAADFATMGIASRIPGGKTFMGKLASQVAQTGVEGVGGMAGEALSQVASGQELQTGDILSEGIGELLPGSAQVAALGARRLLNPTTPPPASPASPTPGGPAPGGVGGNARPPSLPSTPPVDPMDAVADSLDDRFKMKPSVLNPLATPPATEPPASPVEPPVSSPSPEGPDNATASVLRDLGINPDDFASRVERARLDQYRGNPQQAYLDGKITREQLVDFLEERVANSPAEQARRQAEIAATGPGRSNMPMRRVDRPARPTVTLNPENASGFNPSEIPNGSPRVADRLGPFPRVPEGQQQGAASQSPAVGTSTASRPESTATTPPTVPNPQGSSPSPKSNREPFTVKAYRGQKSGQAADERVGGARFFSGARDLAQAYAGDGGEVLEETLTFTNPLITANAGTLKQTLGLPPSAPMSRAIDDARKAGHDGIVMERMVDGPEYVDLSPDAGKKPPREPWQMTRGEYVAENSLLPAMRDTETGRFWIGKRNDIHATIETPGVVGPLESGWATNTGEYVTYADAAKIQGQSDSRRTWAKLRRDHEAAVTIAFANGKPVPPEVLAEYGLSSPESPDNSNRPSPVDSSPQPQGQVAATTNKEPANGEEAPQAERLLTEERSRLLDAIVKRENADREARGRFNIEEQGQLKGTDGNWYYANGFPQGVRSTGERRVRGYSVGSQSFQTREQAEKYVADRKAGDDIRADLADSSIEELRKIAGTAAPAASSDPRGTGAVGAEAKPAKTTKDKPVLWGRRDGGPWLKLTSNTSAAEMKRRRADGWEVLKRSANDSPENDTKAAPKPEGMTDSQIRAAKRQAEEDKKKQRRAEAAKKAAETKAFNNRNPSHFTRGHIAEQIMRLARSLPDTDTQYGVLGNADDSKAPGDYISFSFTGKIPDEVLQAIDAEPHLRTLLRVVPSGGLGADWMGHLGVDEYVRQLRLTFYEGHGKDNYGLVVARRKLEHWRGGNAEADFLLWALDRIENSPDMRPDWEMVPAADITPGSTLKIIGEDFDATAAKYGEMVLSDGIEFPLQVLEAYGVPVDKGTMKKGTQEPAPKPETPDFGIEDAADPLAAVSDRIESTETITMDDGETATIYKLADGFEVVDSPEGVELRRRVGPGVQRLGTYSSVEDAIGSVSPKIAPEGEWLPPNDDGEAFRAWAMSLVTGLESRVGMVRTATNEADEKGVFFTVSNKAGGQSTYGVRAFKGRAFVVESTGGYMKKGAAHVLSEHPNARTALVEAITLEDAPKPAKAEPAPVSTEEATKTLADKGIIVTKTTTKNGTPVWELTGQTFDHKDAIRSAGGRWYGPKKAWSVYDEQAITKLAGTIGGGSTVDGGVAGQAAGVVADSDDDLARQRARERLDATPDERGTGADYARTVTPGTAALIRKGEAFGIPTDVATEQIEDIGMAMAAHRQGRKLFIIGNDAGSGKTFVLGGIIREMRAKFPAVVYVTMNQDLIEQIKRNLKDYDIGGVTFATYSDLSSGKVESTPGQLLILDEAHNIKNTESARGKNGKKAVASAGFTVFASATPYENPVQAEYLAPTGVFDEAGGHTEWAKIYGAAVRKWKDSEGTHEEVYWVSTKDSTKDALQAKGWLERKGVFTQRRIRLDPAMVQARFRRVPVEQKWLDLFNRVLAVYDDALSEWKDPLTGRSRDPRVAAMVAMHRENALKRILEAAKVNAAIDRAKEELAAGRKVAMFVETKSEREIGRYRKSNAKPNSESYTFPQMQAIMREWEQDRAADRAAGDRGQPPPFSPAILTIASAMHDAGIDETLPSVVDEIEAAFGKDAALYTGSVTPAKAAQNREAWRLGKFKVLIITMDKGGTGLSLHDTVGDQPTTQINVNMPWTATKVKQVSARTGRYGLKSKVVMEWLFSADIPFEKRLARRVGGRIRDMGATVSGINIASATKLADFDFKADEDIGDMALGVGTEPEADTNGTEEQYRQANRLEAAERRADDTSGDFFQTPHPIALFMARVAGITSGTKVLEPSAGMGRIVRYIPAGASLTMIEQHPGRVRKLEAMNRGKVVNTDFVQWAKDNKDTQDVVLMNPPFSRIAGEGWQDVSHVMAAWGTLREGGRLVAVMSVGFTFHQDQQSAEFREWVESTGATVFKLPERAFKNSGTGVRTVLLIADKRTGDYADAGEYQVDSMEELPSLEDEVPSRALDRDEKPNEPAPKAATPAPTAPPKFSDSEGVFGQKTENITGSQTGLFGGSSTLKPEPKSTVTRWAKGDVFEWNGKRFMVTLNERNDQTPTNPPDDWVSYVEINKHGKPIAGADRDAGRGQLESWGARRLQDSTPEARESALKAMTPDEAQERYPGIRRGETVAEYEKRIGITDTPDMFGGPSSAGGDPKRPQRAPSNMADRAIGALERIAADAEARMEKRAKKRGTRLYSTPIPDPRDMIDAAAWAAGKALVAGIKGARAIGKFVTDQVAARWPDAKFDPAVLRRTARRFMDGAKTPQDVYARWQAARNRDDAARTKAAAGAAVDPKAVKEAAAVGTAQRPDVAARIVAEVRKSFRAGKEAGRVQALAALKPVITKAKQAAIRAEQMRKIEQRGGKDAAAAATQAAKVQAETEAGIRDEAVRLVQSIPGVGRRYLKAVSTAKGMRDLQRILHRLRKDLAKSVARDSRRRAQAMARMFKKLNDDRLALARKALYDIEEAWKAIKSKDTGTIRAEELAQAMRESAEQIKALITEQRDEDKVRIQGKTILMSEHRDDMVERITRQKELPQTEKVGADRTPGAVRLFMRKYANFRTLMQILDGQFDENGIFARAHRAMAARRTLELAKNQEFIDRAEAIVKANGYKSWADFTKRTTGSLGDASVDFVNIELGDRKRIPVGLAMALYAQDPETKSLMHEGQVFKFHRNDLQGFTVDDYKLAELEAALTPAQKTIAMAINRLRSEMQYDRADAVYKDITGNRLVKVPDHYPRQRILDQTGNPDTIDVARMAVGEWAVQSLENSGFTIQRVNSRAPLLLSDFAETQVRAFQGTEMMIQRAQLVKYLKGTIMHPDVINQINARYGTAMVKRLAGVIAEYSGNSQPESDKIIRRAASKLAQTMTQTNPLTWLRNLSTVFRLPLALVDGSAVATSDVLAAMPKAAASMSKTMGLLLKHSPDLRHRWSHAGAAISLMPTGAAPDADSHFADAGKATIRQLLHAFKGLKTGNFMERAGQAGRAYDATLDAIRLGNTFDGFAAAVAYHVFRAKAPTNLSPAAQDRWAARRAADAFMQTANTNDLLNATEFQTDARRNTMTALLLTFTSDIAKMQNLAYLSGKRGGKSMGVTAGAIVASVAWSTAIRYVAAAVLGDDEEKRDEEAVQSVMDELLSLLPGGVNVLAPAARFLTAGSTYKGSGLLDTPLTSLVKHFEAIVGQIQREDTNAAEVAYRLFRLVADPMGNPLGPISGMARRAIKNYGE